MAKSEGMTEFEELDRIESAVDSKSRPQWDHSHRGGASTDQHSVPSRGESATIDQLDQGQAFNC